MNSDALSRALIHFVWEGAAVALLLAVVLPLARSAGLRYAAACAALFAMPVCFAVTYWFALPAAGTRGPLPVAIPLFDLAVPPSGAAIAAARAPLPWLVILWMTGVGLLYAWRTAGWMAAQRLRRKGVCAAPAGWRGRLAALAQRLRVSRTVALLESSLAETPLTIGILRPAILMPVGVLAGLPAEQVEAILLHELAHIRRFDYLVNLAQSLVEGLLFYHPAVWWVSHVVRREREFCCDDAVVSATGDAPAFAQALGTLEHRRAQRAALAATGGNLMLRVRRLLGQPAPRVAAGPVLGLLLLGVCSGLAAWRPQPAPLPEPPAPAAPQQAAPLGHAEAAPAPSPNTLDDQILYIATAAERAAFIALKSDPERQRFVEEFWQRRDPTPGTPANELREEHQRRVAEANRRFGEGSAPGARTPRGAFYIAFGPPDRVQPPPPGSRFGRVGPTERWRYDQVDGQPLIAWFTDVEGDGRYLLTQVSTPDAPRGARVDNLVRVVGPHPEDVPSRNSSRGGAAVAPLLSGNAIVRTQLFFRAAQQDARGTAEERLRQELETPFSKWLDEEVRWIATPGERTAFQRLTTDDERQTFIEQFWQRRDPTPGTEENEFREEHYRRIAWANDRFGNEPVPGWASDRGMVYIQFGWPDERREETTAAPPRELWTYRLLEGVGQNVALEFDAAPGGSYRLKWEPEIVDRILRTPGVNLLDLIRQNTEIQRERQ